MSRLKSLLKKGAELDHAKDYEAAITCFTEAIFHCPECPEAYQGRGTARLGTGDFLAAVEDFTVATQLAPDRPYYFASLSLAHYAVGEYEQVLNDCDAALRLGSDLPAESMAKLYYTRGMAWKALGQSRRAETAFAKAREFDLDNRHAPGEL